MVFLDVEYPLCWKNLLKKYILYHHPSRQREWNVEKKFQPQPYIGEKW